MTGIKSFKILTHKIIAAISLQTNFVVKNQPGILATTDKFKVQRTWWKTF